MDVKSFPLLSERDATPAQKPAGSSLTVSKPKNADPVMVLIAFVTDANASVPDSEGYVSVAHKSALDARASVPDAKGSVPDADESVPDEDGSVSDEDGFVPDVDGFASVAGQSGWMTK